MSKQHVDERDTSREPNLERLRGLVAAGIECLLRRATVRLIVGLSDTKIDVAEAAGLFPKRVRISSRAAGWKASEIFAYVSSRPLAVDMPPDLAGDLRCKPQRRRALRRARADRHAAQRLANRNSVSSSGRLLAKGTGPAGRLTSRRGAKPSQPHRRNS